MKNLREEYKNKLRYAKELLKRETMSGNLAGYMYYSGVIFGIEECIKFMESSNCDDIATLKK